MMALTVALAVLTGCSVEQILIGQSYIIYTARTGACPRLEWQFVVNPQRVIGGTLSDAAGQPIASLSGTLAADDSFQIIAKAGTGGRTASVTGQFTSQTSTLSIHGDAAGTGCDGQTFVMRLGGYFARQGGGGGGGG